jgi:two-component system invasion response regulator UvrY
MPELPLLSRGHAYMNQRILLVDDHAIVRQGITRLLIERGIATAVVEAEDGAQALQLIERSTFDVVLLDISLPDIDGIEVLKRIRRKFLHLPVLMFSMYREDQYAVRALKAGASGYLSKTANAAQLVAALEQLASGRKYISPTMAEALLDYLSTDSGQLPHEKLSDREYQTLCMLGSGKRLTDIALALSLSVKTVSVYRSRLLEKMHLSNNAELTYYVMTNKLIDPNH